jgi:hypothetical protein
MSVQALSLCEEHGLNFTRAFAQQFLLTTDAGEELPRYQRRAFGKWFLLSGPRMPIAEVEVKDKHDKTIQMIVMGHAVDATGTLARNARLKDVLSESTDIEILERYISGLGGRYIALLRHGAQERLYLDPTGSMGALINRTQGRIASTLHMALTRPTEPSSAYPAELTASRYAFGHTADKDVFALMPNHYLDLETGQMHRFWPKEQSFTCSSLEELDSGIDRVIARHGEIMHALTAVRGPTILPVTGGQDSRVLMAIAAARNLSPDYVFTHITTKNALADSEVAAQLCEALGWERDVLDVMHWDSPLALPPRRVYRYLREAALARGHVNFTYPTKSPEHTIPRREMTATQALPDGGIVLRGHVTDISKAVLWRKLGAMAFIRHGAAGITDEIGTQLLYHDRPELGLFPWPQKHFAAWRATLPDGARDRTLDFMGLELYRNYSLGASFYGFVKNFYVAPGCDREIITLLASAPPAMRYRLQYNQRLIARAAPALRDIPYTRALDNQMLAKNPPFSKSLNAYGLA